MAGRLRQPKWARQYILGHSTVQYRTGLVESTALPCQAVVRAAEAVRLAVQLRQYARRYSWCTGVTPGSTPGLCVYR